MMMTKIDLKTTLLHISTSHIMKVFTNRNLLPFQVISYAKNPFQPGIFTIVRKSETFLQIESMNKFNAYPFIHDFTAIELLEFPSKGWNYLLYGNSIPEDKLHTFYVQDDYKKSYDAYLPKCIKEGDRLWILDYDTPVKQPQMA